MRLHEEPFAVLYATVDSRPNTPVNVLVGLDVLKAGFGWCDEELIDHFRFDLQVRYALGLDSLAEGDFELRTLYYFRSRVSQYNQAHGTNLLSAAFVDITDQQITAFKVRTGLQRMDSTQLAANILDMSRLQLLVEALQRLHRLLSQADQELHATLFAPYLESRSNQYVYRIKGPEATQKHLQLVGQALYQALEALQADYAGEAVYQTVVRLFAENFRVEAATAQAKANGEIGSGCLQSLDDQEASYRSKAGKPYKGYVANVTETCDPGQRAATDHERAGGAQQRRRRNTAGGGHPRAETAHGSGDPAHRRRLHRTRSGRGHAGARHRADPDGDSGRAAGERQTEPGRLRGDAGRARPADAAHLPARPDGGDPPQSEREGLHRPLRD